MISRFRGQFGFLSNMYSCQVRYMSQIFPSAEHAFQWAKNPQDDEWAATCTNTLVSSSDIKRLGKKTKLRKDWDDIRRAVMIEIVRCKFTQNEDLRFQLLNTGTENIVEGNTWHDTFWGVDVTRQPNYGENHLGRILMQVRSELEQS